MSQKPWQRRQTYMKGNLDLNPHYYRTVGLIIHLLGGSCQCGRTNDKASMQFCPLDEGLPDLRRLTMSFNGRTEAWKVYRRYHLACDTCFHPLGHANMKEQDTSGEHLAASMTSPILTPEDVKEQARPLQERINAMLRG